MSSNPITPPVVADTSPVFLLPDKLYNFIKFLALVGIPAIASGYFTLAGTFGLPNTEKVIGFLTVLDTFLGLILGVSTRSYKKATQADGVINITQTPEGTKLYSLELEQDPSFIDTKKTVVFKVKNSSAPPI
jgi:hypothetical protein